MGSCIVYRNDDGSWLARVGDISTTFPTVEQLIEVAQIAPLKVVPSSFMDARSIIELTAACAFMGVSLYKETGEVIVGTPVQSASVRYITREEMGKVLPDGWFIECQLNRYAACWGESMTFPARKTIPAAIADIHEFLGASIKSAADDLLESVAATRALDEMEQLPMWLSSDSPQGAAENSAELDSTD